MGIATMVVAGKTYVVAVSGGVDSVTLLDMINRLPDTNVIVAHFDHGIRPDSAEDARFVSRLAQRYGLKFEIMQGQLGSKASEDIARKHRYAFLRQLARTYDAPIVTAHHSDDIVESVAINHLRGTGWRGLAVMHSDIFRPLLHMTKADITAYAKKNGLEWREDSSNQDTKYLRNKLRQKTPLLSDDARRQILALRAQQIEIKEVIEAEVRRLVGPGPDYDRYFLTHIDPAVAVECLRVVTHGRLTRPQLQRLLLAIKTHRPGTTMQAGLGVSAVFTPRQFVIKLLK